MMWVERAAAVGAAVCIAHRADGKGAAARAVLRRRHSPAFWVLFSTPICGEWGGGGGGGGAP